MEGTLMVIDIVLWLALTAHRPVFRPADLSMQFESAARERSRYRAQIDQIEGVRR